jgi:hypothetical protein
MTTIQMKLRGSRPWRARGLDATGGYSNYFVGADSKSWRTHVPHYAQLKIAGIYDGIDLILYGRNGDLEYQQTVPSHTE